MIYMRKCKACGQGIESYNNESWVHVRTGLWQCAPQGVATP